MPVYIKELVVRARVEDSLSQVSDSPESPERVAIDQRAIVEDCVEEVLRVLERKQER